MTLELVNTLSEKDQLIYNIMTWPKEQFDAWFDSLSELQKINISTLMTPRFGKYVPKCIDKGNGLEPMVLSAKQTLSCLLENQTLLMHGSGSSGKTHSMLIQSLQYADQPKYRGLLVMRNIANLESLVSTLTEWLFPHKNVDFNKVKKIWYFPEGSELHMGYLETDEDKERYKGFNYQFIGVDELTRIKSLEMFSFLYSRNRQPYPTGIPIRMRACTNPGPSWVYDAFINPETRNAEWLHLPMQYVENNQIDNSAYEKTLENMTGVEKIRMKYGDWLVSEDPCLIDPAWIKKTSHYASCTYKQRVRVWDIASTTVSAQNKDPDWTAGALCSYVEGVFTIENVIRLRGTPMEVERKIIDTYDADMDRFGTAVETYVEMGNNSGSKTAIDQLLRGSFAGLNIKAITSNVSKEERARPLAIAAENGYVQMVDAQWNKDLQIELATFPTKKKGLHDDIIDAVVYCYINLVVSRRRVKASVTKYGADRWSDAQLMTVLRSR